MEFTAARIAKLARVASRRVEGMRIVLDGVADPGNRAAIIRSAEAFGILNVHIIPPPVIPGKQTPVARKKHYRAISTGSEKWINVIRHDTPHDCLQDLREKGFRVYCAKPEAPAHDVATRPVPLTELDFSSKTALVFGNENIGVSPQLSAGADGDFTIHMFGLTESLNVSVAAAVCMHWGRYSRTAALGVTTDLSEEDSKALLGKYTSIEHHYGVTPGLTNRNLEEPGAPP
mmetsp:Transcript_705/g.1731  ORF Transcript_705/g.1731 Transcript_705/m.1731 type:complete len:231 (+) Transcript_705:29-721(+)